MLNNYINRLIWSILVICLTNVVVFAQKTFFFSIGQDPIQSPQINWVSVSEENQGILEWEIIRNPNIESLNIYRSQNADTLNWRLLDNIKDLNQNIFFDISSNPTSNIYNYKISVVDYCKKEYFGTSFLNTILLRVAKTLDYKNKLEWNKYNDKGVLKYKIFRGESLGKMQLIDSVSVDSTIYIDKTSEQKNMYYRVEAEEYMNRNGMVNQKKIKSNYFLVVNSRSDSIFEIRVKIFPNPIRSDFYIDFPFDLQESYYLFITDLLGKIHFSTSIDSERIVLNRGKLKDGVYLLHIKGVNNQYVEKVIFWGDNR